MVLTQHTIKPARGAMKKRKRVGRGNASGSGTYSGRGLKGQKARSGVSGLKRLGMKHILLRIPKKKGFKSKKPDNQAVNLFDVNKFFEEGDMVTPQTLLGKKLIDSARLPVKILGQGELKLKNLKISGVKISESAKKQVEKMGGNVKSEKSR